MSNSIENVAVIGSGVMGAGIAAHCANAGCNVLLLDIVGEERDRNSVANSAVKVMMKSNPEMLTHKRNAKLITTGNIEDDLSMLSEVDWVIEVVIENLDVKRDLYSNISKHIGKSTIVSSNTSTIPRRKLVENMQAEMASRFLITHFFNPPRYLPLLEVVTADEVDSSITNKISSFADNMLGKRVILCNDTPGFIGNRLGVYFIQRALKGTIDHKLTIEQADAMLGRPIGVPKTGVFGLMDLVGIDLVPHVTASLLENLPEDDPFHEIAGTGVEIVDDMLAEGYIGRKGKGGFYRLNTEGGQRVKEARDLNTGKYRPADRRAAFPSAKMGKQGLRRLIDHPDRGAKFVAEVLLDTLSYAAHLVPDVSDDIYSIDTAMKIGYNWKKGPFEMMDSIGIVSMVERLEASGRGVPPMLVEAAKKGSFYEIVDNETTRLTTEGKMEIIDRPTNTLKVADLKRRGTPIKKNGSASIWDMGDDILLVEYHSKMNAVDPFIIEILVDAVDIAETGDWRGIVIGNDGANFCAGANLGLVLFAINLAAWKDVEEFIVAGQEAYQALKFCEVPVVAASAGMCLGGGAEVLLHCDAVQAHCESYIGLVEVGVGIVPAWGGCKELLGRLSEFKLVSEGPMGAVMKAFEYIGTAKVSKSAEQARTMGFLAPNDGITMNRDRLLADAKKKAIDLAEGYCPPEPRNYVLPGETGLLALELAINDFALAGQATPHDVVVTKKLARVLTGGSTDITESVEEEEILELEREAIGWLGRQTETLDRMEHMLETGKPLRN